MVADPERRVGVLDVELRVPGNWDADQRATLERAAVNCPVFKSLNPAIEIPVRFDWGA